MADDDANGLEYSLSFPNQRRKGDNRPLIHQRGFWFLSNLHPAINATIRNFKPHPTDVILASFPKTGTTWLKALLYSLVHPESRHQLATQTSHALVPSLEFHVYGKPSDSPVTNPLSIYDTNLPRVFHTHIPYQLLSTVFNPFQGRIVYVARNPKDTLVSYWHFVNKSTFVGDEPWPIEIAVEKFCTGVFPFGPYYEHVLEYKRLSLERPENVLFLTYEELKTDPKSVVQMLAWFLGFPIEGEERVEEIVNGCSFEVLSEHDVNKSEEPLPLNGYTIFPMKSFYRKGEVGDYRNTLTKEMIEKIDALTREKFHSSGFMYGI